MDKFDISLLQNELSDVRKELKLYRESLTEYVNDKLEDEEIRRTVINSCIIIGSVITVFCLTYVILKAFKKSRKKQNEDSCED